MSDKDPLDEHIVPHVNLGITGHRPDKLWGYRNERGKLRAALWTKLEELLLKEMPDYAITGMAQGADQLYAEVCRDLRIPYIALIPCSGQESVWPAAAQKHYNDLLADAHKVVNVSPGPYQGWKMQRRNKEIVWQSSKLIAVWDGSSGGTASCVAFATQEKKPIIFIDPKDL